MKEIIKINFFTFLTVTFILLFLSCNNPKQKITFNNDKKYFIIFEENPKIINDTIEYKGFVIGTIVNQKLTRSGKYVSVEIRIKKDYDSLIQTNSTFYVDNQVLVYTTLGKPKEKILPQGANIYGFNSLTALNWFLTKEWVNRKSKSFQEFTNEKLKQLLE